MNDLKLHEFLALKTIFSGTLDFLIHPPTSLINDIDSQLHISLFCQIMNVMRKIVSMVMNMIQQLGIVRAKLDGLATNVKVS